MKETRDIMGMPVTVAIADKSASAESLEAVYSYFAHVDDVFSTYKETSEIARINRKELVPEAASAEMREVLQLSEETKQATNGYFDIKKPDGSLDPSGLVKGWAIRNAARLLEKRGHTDFYVDAGGDVQVKGVNEKDRPWSIGIRSPFAPDTIVKVIYPRGAGVATSGAYLRGAHIWDPHTGAAAESELASISVIGPDVYEADRFATAAYAMGMHGIHFIESLPGLEGYAIHADKQATMTSGLETYL